MPLDLSPQPIKLVVPDEYKRFFYRKWNVQVLWAVIPSLFITLLGLFTAVTGGFSILRFEWVHLAVFPVAFFAWHYWLRTPFSYHVNKHGIGVIDCSRSSWSWHLISWKDSIILSITDSTWHDLPALTIRVAAKVDSTITYHSDWQLIYCPEDNHKVRDRVIPAIEYYRQKYGHGEWIAQHGWQNYAGTSKLVADA